MDKFGIFNLLSSILGAPSESASGKNQNFTINSPPFNHSENHPAGGKVESEQAENRATFAPLQNSMLQTMKNHDEFVKRVKKHNKSD